jgi:hypothetical protein
MALSGTRLGSVPSACRRGNGRVGRWWCGAGTRPCRVFLACGTRLSFLIGAPHPWMRRVMVLLDPRRRGGPAAPKRAWLADPRRGDDGPWRDLMRAAHADGHAAELRNLLGELMHTRDAEVPEDLAPDTYAWLLPLLPDLLSASTTSS